MVWLFSRKRRPCRSSPAARTGMRIKTRELRRSLWVFSIVWVSVLTQQWCILTQGESTEGYVASVENVLFRCIMFAVVRGNHGPSPIYRKPPRRESERPKGIPAHPQRQHENRTQAGHRARRAVVIEAVEASGHRQSGNRSDQNASLGLRGVSAAAGPAHGAFLRTLRRAATGTSGPVDLAGV